MKDVLISVDERLWGRMKARAALEGRTTKDVVANAFRVYLAQHGAVEPDGRADTDPKLEARGADAGEKAGALDLLRRAGLVTTGSDLHQAQEDAARTRERRVRAYQDRTRSHPEEASQDPADVPAGFEEE